MKAIFMRHAQSEYNVNNMINQDPKIRVKITEKGMKQAEEAGKKLANEKFNIIFVSDFFRTKQTARLVNRRKGVKIKRFLRKSLIAKLEDGGERQGIKTNLTIKQDKRISEIKLGFEGENVKNYRKARRESGEKINLFRFRKELENFHDVRKRVENFIDWLRKQKFDSFLVVTHEICVQAARCVLEEIDEEIALSLPIGNCKFFKYEI